MIDYERYKKKKQRVQRCFVTAANKLSIYDGVVNNGILQIEEGKIKEFSLVPILCLGLLWLRHMACLSKGSIRIRKTTWGIQCIASTELLKNNNFYIIRLDFTFIE